MLLSGFEVFPRKIPSQHLWKAHRGTKRTLQKRREFVPSRDWPKVNLARKAYLANMRIVSGKDLWRDLSEDLISSRADDISQ